MNIATYIKKESLLAFLVLLAATVQAQTQTKTEQYFGVRGAYSMSSASFNPYKKTTSISGADFGVSYKLYAEKYMGTQIELNYIQKGYAVVDTTYKATAIELPAMAQGFVRFGAV